MRIDLINKTHYRDDHIRKFLVKAIQIEREDLCKRGARPMRVHVGYRHNTKGSSGCAYLKSHWMKVRLPKDVNKIDKIDFAHVIAHELAHTRGLDHRRMTGSPIYDRVGRWREIYAWGETFPLEVKPKVVRTRPLPDAKLSHCERMLRAAMTREKRATTIRKKWQMKVKYYGKKIAAKGKMQEEELVENNS